jgi:hypothetical protein
MRSLYTIAHTTWNAMISRFTTLVEQQLSAGPWHISKRVVLFRATR